MKLLVIRQIVKDFIEEFIEHGNIIEKLVGNPDRILTIYIFRTCSIFITVKVIDMDMSLKNKILQLRIDGKNYNEIQNELKCSKATISYHCKRMGLNGNSQRILTDDEKNSINDYYKTHTIDETASYFNIGRSTVIKHVDNKHQKFTTEELILKNRTNVKSHRQRLKERAIEYKGGSCEKCGYNRCIGALEFHHNNPNEKDFGISSYRVLAWERVKIELDKCILVCANCHREIHDEINNRDVPPQAYTL